MEQVCLLLNSEPGSEVAARLPDPRPEHLSKQSRLQIGSPRDCAHSLLHPGCWVLWGRVEANAMLPGAWGESWSAPPHLSPSQSRRRGSQAACKRSIPSPSQPRCAVLAGVGNLEGLQWRIWQADLSQLFPVQTNVVKWFTEHFILTAFLPFFE